MWRSNLFSYVVAFALSVLSLSAPVALAQTVFPPGTPTTDTVIHVFAPFSSGSWYLEAPHAPNATPIKFNASTTTTLRLAPKVYILRFSKSGKVYRQGRLIGHVSPNQYLVFKVGLADSRVYGVNPEWNYKGSVSASSYGNASASARVRIYALHYDIYFGDYAVYCGSSQGGLPCGDSWDFDGYMLPGIVHFADTPCGCNSGTGGSGASSATVTFYTPSGNRSVSGGCGSSDGTPPRGGYQRVEIDGEPLDDLDFFVDVDGWMFR